MIGLSCAHLLTGRLQGGGPGNLLRGGPGPLLVRMRLGLDALWQLSHHRRMLLLGLGLWCILGLPRLPGPRQHDGSWLLWSLRLLPRCPEYHRCLMLLLLAGLLRMLIPWRWQSDRQLMWHAPLLLLVGSRSRRQRGLLLLSASLLQHLQLLEAQRRRLRLQLAERRCDVRHLRVLP